MLKRIDAFEYLRWEIGNSLVLDFSTNCWSVVFVVPVEVLSMVLQHDREGSMIMPNDGHGK